MSLLFEFKPQQSRTLQDLVSEIVGTITGTLTLQETVKGVAASCAASSSLSGFGAISGIYALAIILKPTGDTTLIQDDGSDLFGISGGVYAGTGMTATYINGLESTTALPYQWQLVIAEFSGGIEAATDFMLALSALCQIARVQAFDAMLTVQERYDLFQVFHNRTTTLNPIIVDKWSPVFRGDGATHYTRASINNFRSSDSSGSIECWIQFPDALGYYTIFTSAYEISDDYYFSLQTYPMTGQVYFLSKNLSGILKYVLWTTNVCDGKRHHLKFSSSGSSYTLEIDGVMDTINSFANNDGSWFSSIANRQNVVWGSFYRKNPVFFFNGFIDHGVIRDPGGTIVNYWPMNEGCGTVLYDSIGGVNLDIVGGDFWHLSSYNQVFSWVAERHTLADGTTYTAGQQCAGWRVESGSIKSLSTSLSLECLTNAIISIPVMLSEFIGSGYVRELTGSLSTEQGKTVDAATGLSYSDGILSLSLTAGQTLESLVIVPSADFEYTPVRQASLKALPLRGLVWQLGKDAYSLRTHSLTITEATSENGVWTFDGTDDKIEIPTFSLPVYSFRIRIYLESTTEDILTLSSTQSIEAVAGTITATGVTSPTIYVDGVAGATITAEAWHEIIVTTGTPIVANAVVIGYISAYLEGQIDSTKTQAFDRVLTADEVSALYEESLFSGLITENLEAYYNFANGTAQDWSGNGHHGSVESGVQFIKNYGASFDASGRVGCGELLNFDTDDPFTLFFIFENNGKGGSKTIMSKYGAVLGDVAGWSVVLSGGILRLYMLDNVGAGSLVTNTATLYNTGTHFGCFTYNGNGKANGVKFYSQYGEQTLTPISDTLSGSILSPGIGMYIGGRDAGGVGYDSVIKACGGWNACLTGEQVAQNIQYFKDRGFLT